MYDVDVRSGSALFFALTQDQSDATVCDLIDMNPLALTMIDTEKDTPLLIALYRKRSFQVVHHMVRTNRDVVMYTRDNVTYPLTVAINCNMDPRIIALLVDENGELLRRRNRLHRLPALVAITKGCHVEALKQLVYPDCVDIYD